MDLDLYVFECPDCGQLKVLCTPTMPEYAYSHWAPNDHDRYYCYGTFQPVQRPDVITAFRLGGDQAVLEIACQTT